MDTSILKSKLQQKISDKITNNLIIEAVILKADQPITGDTEDPGWLSADNALQALFIAQLFGVPVTPAIGAALRGVGRGIGDAGRGIGAAGPHIARGVAAASPYIAAAAPSVAMGALGAAAGTIGAYGVNTALDAMDPNTWKTGGSRAKMQLELLGLGDKDTFAQAWKDVGGGVMDSVRQGFDVRLPGDILQHEVKSEEKARKEQVFKDNPNLKADLEAERRQRAANREQDEREQKERESKRQQESNV